MERNPLEYSGTLRVDDHTFPLSMDLRGTRSMNAAVVRGEGEAKKHIGILLDGTRFTTDDPIIKEMMRRLERPHEDAPAMIALQTTELLRRELWLTGKELDAPGSQIVRKPFGVDQDEYTLMLTDVDPQVVPLIEQALRSPIQTEKSGIRHALIAALQTAIRSARITPSL